MRLLKTALTSLALAAGLSAAAASSKVVIVVGPSNHPPGTHEVAAGARVMKWAIEHMSNLSGVTAEVHEGWPADKGTLESARTIVFIGDIFPPQKMAGKDAVLKEVGALMERGVGIVCVHYATGLRAEDVAPDGAHPLLGWLGGYFATRTPHHQSVAKVFESATITPAAPGHPVSRGWREFTLPEEPYYNNYFGGEEKKPQGKLFTFATSMLPPEAPKREAVAWGIERKDGGRGFGIVMPHFYKSWANEDLRRFILNGIVWTAKMNVPREGVKTPAPDLTQFSPESVEPKPRVPARK